MARLKVGAFLASFRLDFRSALAMASELELDGLQFSSLHGEIDIEDISAARAAEIVDIFGDYGLVISAVCGDIGGFSLEDADEAMRRVERTLRIMDITKSLQTSIVQTHIGFIPEDFSDPRVSVLRRSLERIGEYGQKTGVVLATETGPEPASTMKRFLDTIQIPSIRVNYDPANLAMNGFDQIAGVYELKDYIVHSHAKDGRREPDAKGRQEQALGEGDVDFPRYIAAMDEIGYDGFYIIERETGDDPVKDITDAKRFLDRF